MSKLTEKDQLNDLIEKCDQLIKAGELSSVAGVVSQLNLSKIPRAHLQSLAKICRRAGLIQQGLRLLHPVIRNEKTNDEPPSSGELCEYSVLLSRNGSTQEALRLLESVDAEQIPEALLYKAYCHISNWDYSLAVPLLEQFLNASVDEYSKLIARVNLASSYLAIYEFTSALELLKETLPIAEALGSSRLAGNCLDLIGHVYFYQNEFSKSRESLNRALTIFGQSSSDDRLMVQKTDSFMKALEEKSLTPLEEFRKLATRARRWEWVRETDLYRAKIECRQTLVDHLIFGSPLPAFRKRVEKELGVQASDTYLFGSNQDKIFDLRTGSVTEGKLNAGKKIHQTLAVLLKDFYAPRTLGSLFADLYPDEYFNVNSSPKRIGQLLLRTRRWIEENEIPALIVEQDGAYQFQIQGEFGIELSLHSTSIENDSLKWAQLATCFPTGVSFSPQLACETLNWTRSTFLRVINLALKEGKVERAGSGRHVLYSVVLSQSKTKSSAA